MKLAVLFSMFVSVSAIANSMPDYGLPDPLSYEPSKVEKPKEFKIREDQYFDGEITSLKGEKPLMFLARENVARKTKVGDHCRIFVGDYMGSQLNSVREVLISGYAAFTAQLTVLPQQIPLQEGRLNSEATYKDGVLEYRKPLRKGGLSESDSNMKIKIDPWLSQPEWMVIYYYIPAVQARSEVVCVFDEQ